MSTKPDPTFGGRWLAVPAVASWGLPVGPETHPSLLFSRRQLGVGESWMRTEGTLDKSCLVLTLPICKLGEPVSPFSSSSKGL